MTATVSQRAGKNIGIYLDSDVSNRIPFGDIVVVEVLGKIKIREATILDNKTRSFAKNNNGHNCSRVFTICTKNHQSFLGKWKVEQEGDWFILTEKISS